MIYIPKKFSEILRASLFSKYRDPATPNHIMTWNKHLVGVDIYREYHSSLCCYDANRKFPFPNLITCGKLLLALKSKM